MQREYFDPDYDVQMRTGANLPPTPPPMESQPGSIVPDDIAPPRKMPGGGGAGGPIQQPPDFRMTNSPFAGVPGGQFGPTIGPQAQLMSALGAGGAGKGGMPQAQQAQAASAMGAGGAGKGGAQQMAPASAMGAAGAGKGGMQQPQQQPQQQMMRTQMQPQMQPQMQQMMRPHQSMQGMPPGGGIGGFMPYGAMMGQQQAPSNYQLSQMSNRNFYTDPAFTQSMLYGGPRLVNPIGSQPPEGGVAPPPGSTPADDGGDRVPRDRFGRPIYGDDDDATRGGGGQ